MAPVRNNTLEEKQYIILVNLVEQRAVQESGFNLVLKLRGLKCFQASNEARNSN